MRHLLELTGVERPASACCRPPAAMPQDGITDFYAALDRFDCEPSPRLAVPARARADRPAPPPARAGPDLRRRRVDAEPDRDLAGARARPRSCAEAWQQGIVLAGQSAGAMCWFELRDHRSSGRPRRRCRGLGLLPGQPLGPLRAGPAAPRLPISTSRRRAAARLRARRRRRAPLRGDAGGRGIRRPRAAPGSSGSSATGQGDRDARDAPRPIPLHPELRGRRTRRSPSAARSAGRMKATRPVRDRQLRTIAEWRCRSSPRSSPSWRCRARRCPRARAGRTSRSGTASARSPSSTATTSTSRAAAASRCAATSPSSGFPPGEYVLDGELVILGDDGARGLRRAPEPHPPGRVADQHARRGDAGGLPRLRPAGDGRRRALRAPLRERRAPLEKLVDGSWNEARLGRADAADRRPAERSRGSRAARA